MVLHQLIENYLLLFKLLPLIPYDHWSIDSSRTRGNLAKAWEFGDGSELVIKKMVQVMQNQVILDKIMDG